MRFQIEGEAENSGTRILNEDNFKVLKRSAVDSFIMSVKRLDFDSVKFHFKNVINFHYT